jgi:glutamine cyclotransferase
MLFNSSTLEVTFVCYCFLHMFSYVVTFEQHIKDMRFSTLSGEGWGMTFDGHHLIVSDGSASIAFWYLPEEDASQPVMVRATATRVEHLFSIAFDCRLGRSE